MELALLSHRPHRGERGTSQAGRVLLPQDFLKWLAA